MLSPTKFKPEPSTSVIVVVKLASAGATAILTAVSSLIVKFQSKKDGGAKSVLTKDVISVQLIGLLSKSIALVGADVPS